MDIFDLNKTIDDEQKIIKKCLRFLMHNGKSAIPNGKYAVDENGIILIVTEYMTHPIENSKWEAHKEYADLQVVLEGEDYIDISDLDTMEIGDYHAKEDYLECKGEAMHTLRLNKNVCVLLLPEDAHIPGISINDNPAAVKKAVFKIPIRYFE